MAFLSIGDRIRIETTDEKLDRFVELLEEASEGGTGFWISSNLTITKGSTGERLPADLSHGYQRVWISGGSAGFIGLVFDRPMPPDPGLRDLRL